MRFHNECHPTNRLFCGYHAQEEGGANFFFCILCGCYSSLRAVGLKHVCKGTRSCKLTIRTRLCERKHPISLAPIVDVHRVMLSTVTRQLRTKVMAVAGGVLAAAECGWCQP
jgi:hypothetical protein